MLKGLLFLLPLLAFLILLRLTPSKPKAGDAAVPAPAPPPVAQTQQTMVQTARDIFRRLDGETPEQIQGELSEFVAQANQSAADNTARATGLAKMLHLAQGPDGDKLLQLAYARERLVDPKTGSYADALGDYNRAARTPFAAVADMRVAQIAETLRENTRDPNVAADAQKQAMGALERMTNLPPEAETLLRDPPVAAYKLQEWRTAPARENAARWLDKYYQSDWRYQILDVLVRLTGAKKSFSYVFAIFLIAVIAKLITTPFTASQFRSMRKMSAVQPELKKLQEKLKGNKEELAKAQMALFKEHGVNPASSCLPMIIQLVILWQVYYAIRHFMWGFWGVHFLYLPNLALPDMLPGAPGFPGPLLIVYAVSMYFSTKLTAMPSATPEQQQQQRMMSVLMPVMLLFVMRSLPAAFILYWLLQNIFMTGHQWLIMRPHREEMAAVRAGAAGAGKQAPKEKALTPPPPAAIERISQGTKPSAKKKRKRRY